MVLVSFNIAEVVIFFLTKHVPTGTSIFFFFALLSRWNREALEAERKAEEEEAEAKRQAEKQARDEVSTLLAVSGFYLAVYRHCFCLPLFK